MTAEDIDRLIGAAAGGDRAAAAAVRREVLAASGSPDHLSAWLDPLARSAAGGAVASTDLLIWAVDTADLAKPAIRSLILDRGAVDEIDQDVLIAVAESISSYRGDARFTTWLQRIARNKAVDHLRRRHRRLAAETVGIDDDGPAARISSMIATRTTLRSVIDSLEPRYRDAVVLRDVEHLPYEEIAARLDLNLNTVRTRIARGRAQVAARLGPA